MTLNIFTQAIYSLRYPRIGNSTLEPGEKVLSEIIYILRSLVKTLQTNIAKKRDKTFSKIYSIYLKKECYPKLFTCSDNWFNPCKQILPKTDNIFSKIYSFYHIFLPFIKGKYFIKKNLKNKLIRLVLSQHKIHTCVIRLLTCKVVIATQI